VRRDDSGWQITNIGRQFLDSTASQVGRGLDWARRPRKHRASEMANAAYWPIIFPNNSGWLERDSSAPVVPDPSKGHPMRILAMILGVLFGSYSFALAQSTSSSGNPPAAGQPTSGGTAASTETNTVGTNSGATLNAAGPQRGNPTNALNVNRVAPTTGNPLIQSGKVK
jgi:hypothetical protein